MPFKKGETPKGAKPFEKGLTGNPNGRPKKLITLLKAEGYSELQVTDTLKVLFALGLDELKKIQKSNDHTVLERTIAGALTSGYGRKSLNNIMQLIERTFGKPKENIDHNLKGKVKVTFKINK